MLNLSQVQPGSSIALKVEALDVDQRPMSGVKLIPDTVSVRPGFMTAVPKRLVIVVPKFIGTPPSGVQLVDYKVQPYQLLLAGSTAELQAISTIETTPIDLSKLTASGFVTVDPVIPKRARLIGGGKVKVEFKLKPTVATIPNGGAGGP
jgi:YbbR domain-containing protein